MASSAYVLVGCPSETTAPGGVYFGVMRRTADGSSLNIAWSAHNTEVPSTYGTAVAIDDQENSGDGSGLVAATASEEDVYVWRLKDSGEGKPFTAIQASISSADLAGYTAVLREPSIAVGNFLGRDVVVIGNRHHNNGEGCAIYFTSQRSSYSPSQPLQPTRWLITGFVVGTVPGGLHGTSVGILPSGMSYVGAPGHLTVHEYTTKEVTGGVFAPVGYVPRGAPTNDFPEGAPAAPVAGVFAPPPSMGGMVGPGMVTAPEPEGGSLLYVLWIITAVVLIALVILGLAMAATMLRKRTDDGGHRASAFDDELSALDRPLPPVAKKPTAKARGGGAGRPAAGGGGAGAGTSITDGDLSQFQTPVVPTTAPAQPSFRYKPMAKKSLSPGEGGGGGDGGIPSGVVADALDGAGVGADDAPPPPPSGRALGGGDLDDDDVGDD